VRDLPPVLFPPVLMIFFFAAFALPVGFALAWWHRRTSRALCRHVARLLPQLRVPAHGVHLPASAPGGALAVVGRLKGLHQAHHDPRLMAHYNFNITYPIFDVVFGTLRRPHK